MMPSTKGTVKVMGSNSARMVWPVVSLLKMWLLTAPTLWPSATYCSSRVSWLISLWTTLWKMAAARG